MKFNFNSEGGFAGLRRSYSGDTASLPDSIKQIFESMTEKPDEYQKIQPNPFARDAMVYTFEIEDRKKTLVFTFDDTNIPQDIIPLIDFCNSHADVV